MSFLKFSLKKYPDFVELFEKFVLKSFQTSFNFGYGYLRFIIFLE